MYFMHLIVGGNDVDESGIPLGFLWSVYRSLQYIKAFSYTSIP